MVPDNYKTVFESDIFWTELKNSTIVGIATMVASWCLASW